MVLERVPREKVIAATVSYPDKNLSIRFVKQQVGKDVGYIQDFFHRADVASVVSSLPAKRVDFKREIIKARDGENHDYLVIRQGRQRFLFDMPEDPTTSVAPSEMTLVVPYRVASTRSLLPKPEENGFHRFRNMLDTARFLHIVEKEGYFAGRDTGASVETNTDFIQPVPALLVTDTPHRRRSLSTHLVLPIRSTFEGANMDNRLAGKIVTPFAMGHTDPEDFGTLRGVVKQAAYREIAEETAYKRTDGSIFHAFAEHDNTYRVTFPGILRLYSHYRIKPFGTVYLEDQPIDKVHVGFLMLAEPRSSRVAFVLNGKSKEAHQLVAHSPEEYNTAIRNGEYIPASWNELIFQEGLMPYLRRGKRR